MIAQLMGGAHISQNNGFLQLRRENTNLNLSKMALSGPDLPQIIHKPLKFG